MKSATARGLLGKALRREGDFDLHDFLLNDGSHAVAWVAGDERLAHEALLRVLELRALHHPRLAVPTVT
jgi:hypothetical protein